MLSHGDAPLCQNFQAYDKGQCHFARLKFNFYIEVKGQGHTVFMNVRDTSNHGDILMCHTKYDYVKEQKS